MTRCCPNPRCRGKCPEYAIHCPYCGTQLRGESIKPQPEDKKRVPCGACGFTGYSDGPVQQKICPICKGTRYVSG